MAWPAVLNPKIVQIKIKAPNAEQTPAVGRVVFDLPYALYDPAGNLIVGAIPDIIAELDDNGEASIELPACNSPGITPLNWTYRVRIETDVQKQEYRVSIPYDVASPIKFANLAPATNPPQLVIYALATHNHDNYLAKALFQAKGDLLVGTGDGTLIRLPVSGVNGRTLIENSATATGLEWAAGGGGLGRWRGDWAPATTYDPGDVVRYLGDIFGTTTGVAADVTPWSPRTFFTSVLTTVDAADSGDYQMLFSFTVSEEIRLYDATFDKTATQNAIPHEMRVFDLGLPSGSATPIASMFCVGETGAGVGKQRAPFILDAQPGRNYRMSLLTGAALEAGYAYTPNFFTAGSITVGAVTGSAGGFANGFAGVGTVTNPNTYYSGVGPRWQEINPGWSVLGRSDPVVIGNSRAYNYPVIP